MSPDWAVLEILRFSFYQTITKRPYITFVNSASLYRLYKDNCAVPSLQPSPQALMKQFHPL